MLSLMDMLTSLKLADLRFWWIEHSADPVELTGFPWHCHKFIVLLEGDSLAHVIASDGRLDQHAEIATALAAWGDRTDDESADGPLGGLSGGGHGGSRFPGFSQAFGPAPEAVVRAIRGQVDEDAGPSVIPERVRSLVERSGCASLDELTAATRDDFFVEVVVDRDRGSVEIALTSPDGASRECFQLPVADVERLF